MPDLIVAGYDTASTASAVTIVRGSVRDGELQVVPLSERPFPCENTMRSRYACATGMAHYTSQAVAHFGHVDLCVFEEYLNMSFSAVAFSMGELGGMSRYAHRYMGLPILLNVPTRMRCFIANGRKIPPGPRGKVQMVEWCKEDFGYVPNQTRAKPRSDCADAFVHATMGVVYLLLQSGALPLDSLSDYRANLFAGPKGLLTQSEKLFVEGIRDGKAAQDT